MPDELLRLEEEFRKDLQKISRTEDLEDLRNKFLGRKGLLVSAVRSLKSAPEEERVILCLEANRLRRNFMEIIVKHTSKEI